MARKLIASKLKLFILKLWELARLSAAMASVNLVFPPQKLNLNETLQLYKRGFNTTSSWIPSVSVMRFTVQMSKLNGLGKTHQKRICRRTENFARPFTTKKIFWDNSDIKWIKVPSINSIVAEYLTFKLSRYFLWRIKINYRRFLGRFSTNLMTLLFIQIHFETNIFLKIQPALNLKWGNDFKLKFGFNINSHPITEDFVICICKSAIFSKDFCIKHWGITWNNPWPLNLILYNCINIS